jgi:microcystin degradation protein MlrC
MRIAIAGFWLESVTFLPDTTDIPEFERSAKRGTDVIAGFKGTATPQGGLIDTFLEAGVELIGITDAGVGAAAAASDDAYGKYVGEIVDGLGKVKGEIDAVAIHLHGALATPTNRKADAGVLEAIRAVIGPDIPITCPMDYHANLAPESLVAADIITGFRYSPHTDMWETGARAARLLLGKLRGEINPVMAMAKPGIALPSVFSATTLDPLSTLVSETESATMKTPGLLDCSLFGGFSYADTPDTGMTALAIADGDVDCANQWAEAMAKRCWSLRDQLFKRELVLDVEAGVDRAQAVAARSIKPVCILEQADRLNDSTYVLRELIKRDVERAYVPFMFDPEAARAAADVGAGGILNTPLFGKSSLRAGGSITTPAKVRWAGPLRFNITGPLKTGMEIDVGAAALLEIGGILVSVISVQWSAIDMDCFTQFADVHPQDFDIILLRSKTHFREVYEPMCAEIIVVDTPDWGPAELANLPYEYLPAGVYPVSA